MYSIIIKVRLASEINKIKSTTTDVKLHFNFQANIQSFPGNFSSTSSDESEK